MPIGLLVLLPLKFNLGMYILTSNATIFQMQLFMHLNLLELNCLRVSKSSIVLAQNFYSSGQWRALASIIRLMTEVGSSSEFACLAFLEPSLSLGITTIKPSTASGRRFLPTYFASTGCLLVVSFPDFARLGRPLFYIGWVAFETPISLCAGVKLCSS